MDSSTTWKQRLAGAVGALTVAGVVPALCGCAADALADAIPSAAFLAAMLVGLIGGAAWLLRS